MLIYPYIRRKKKFVRNKKMTELNISEISFQISNVIGTATIDGRGSKERQFFTMNYISLLTFFLLSNSFAAFLFAQLIQLLFWGNKLYGQKKNGALNRKSYGTKKIFCPTKKTPSISLLIHHKNMLHVNKKYSKFLL